MKGWQTWGRRLGAVAYAGLVVLTTLGLVGGTLGIPELLSHWLGHLGLGVLAA